MVQLAVRNVLLDAHDRATASAELTQHIEGEAVVGAVVRGLHQHHPLDPEHVADL